MKVILNILFVLILSNLVFPQKFAPLNVGNIWIYREDSGAKVKVNITNDTIINNSKWYKVNWWNRSVFAKLNESDSLYTYFENGIIPPDTLFNYYKRESITGSKWEFQYSIFHFYKYEVVAHGSADIFGKQVIGRRIHIDSGLLTAVEIWTDEFGLITGISGEKSEPYYQLLGCVIDGVVYGDTSMTTAIREEPYTELNFKLYQNYPNPFNPSTKITFEITEREKVVLKVYDVLGKEIALLLNEEVSPGKYSVDFDANELPAGVYIACLQAGNRHQTTKMILQK